MNYIDKFNKRYASKMMNGTQFPDEKVANILEAVRLAPTSLGMQPFKIFVVRNQAFKDKIFETAAQGQPQIPTCSHLLIFAPYKKITAEMVDEYFTRIATTRNQTSEKLAGYRKMVSSMCELDEDKTFVWASRQAYIALGFALAAAALDNIDSVPIEGFSSTALDTLLQLDAQNVASTCMMAIGNRDVEKDYNAYQSKVRKPAEMLFEYLD